MSAPGNISVWLEAAVLPWLSSLGWQSIAGSVFLSLAASALFWTLTFKISLTDVWFSPKLEKSPSTQGTPGYRVRVMNLGSRDLIEISMTVRMIIDLDSLARVLHLDCGNQNFLPVLHRWRRPAAGDRFRFPTLTISISDSMMSELQRNLYTDHIRISALKGKVLVDDIFQEYSDRVKIRFYLYGTDCVTGARRLFLSPVYTIADVQEGTFHSTKGLSFPRFKRKKRIADMCFQIDPPGP